VVFIIKVLLWLVLAFFISCQETTYKKEMEVDNSSSAAFTNESGEVVTTVIAVQDSLAVQNGDHNLSCQEILDPTILAQNVNNVSFNQVNTCRNANAEQQQMAFLEQADHDSCGTDHILKRPGMREQLIAAEETIVSGRAQRALVGQSVSDSTTYVLPVVFHVIHRGEPIGDGPNISDAQIHSAVTALNNHFRKVPGTSGDGAGVDFNIEFVLAKRDPNNNPHSGINRVNGSSVPNFSTLGIQASGSGADEIAVKNLSRWDNLKYINIWVVPEIDDNNGGNGIQGYAYFPTSTNSNAAKDGIVILHSATGTIGSVKSNTNKGTVLSHEMGHHFSLYHTFNGTNVCGAETNCLTSGDRVCDTPPTIINASCSNRACGGTQQVENYMDYSSQSCQNMFTQGQRDRSRDSLLSLREELVDSLGGIPVNNLDVAILNGSIPSFVCQAGVVPSVRISNYGSTTISSATVRYRIDNGAWVNSNYVGSLPSGSIATITFPALGLISAGNHTIEFNVTSPNNGTDQAPSNNSQTMTFNSPAVFENFNFKLTLDYYGAENNIEVKSGLASVFSAGPFQNGVQGTVVNNNICLPVGCFDFIIKDGFNDGQSFTSGKYEIFNGSGAIVATNTGNWGSLKTHNICATGATSGGTSGGGTSGGGTTTGGGGGGGDVTAPSVSITSPTQDTVSNGGATNLISISATASDNIGVSRVEFYRNTTLIASDSTSPYSTSWNVSSLTSANYNLSAKAFDAAGNSTTSNVVVFSLDKVAPTGSFISPVNASLLLPTTLLSASGTDNNGIKRIEFYQGSVLLNSDVTSPYEFNWNTSSLPNGNYTLSIKIFDNAENMFSPSTISVSKSTSTSTAPPSTYPGIILGCYSLAQLESLQNALGCQSSCAANLDVNGDGRILINDYLEMRGRICHE
jgi:hypothetical protein